MRWMKLALLHFLIAVGSFVVTSCDKVSESRESHHLEDPSSLRIVTMSPSAGEIAHILGLGNQVVGVSRFTKYPPEFLEKPKIGGYLDVDTEAIIRLDADVVVLLNEQADLATQLEKFGMHTLMVDHMSLDGIVESIRVVGSAFDRSDAAEEAVASFVDRVETVRLAAHQGNTPKVLLSIGREMGVGKVNGLIAAGAAGVHQELLKVAGFHNAYAGVENFPNVTREHLIRMNPDVIVDMVNGEDIEQLGVEAILRDWQQYQELDAVRNARVYVLAGDQHYVPGPRLCDTLEWLAHVRQEVARE